ncbi:MAG: hypothetical protein HKN11_12930 [Rhizobiales bacterium]|nr:hypothetical protein [Hyphomicrobiales bacterium]
MKIQTKPVPDETMAPGNEVQHLIDAIEDAHNRLHHHRPAGEDPEQQIALGDIADHLIRLRAVARHHELKFLTYLIEMAAMEALRFASPPQE